MFMDKLINIKTLISIVSIVGLSLNSGCGDSGVNNDQGASFMATGFYDDSTGLVGRTGDVIPLFTDVQQDRFSDSQYWVFIGLRNRLSEQFIRVVRIDCGYEIEGSFINIPSDSFAFSSVLGPGGGPPPTGTGQQGPVPGGVGGGGAGGGGGGGGGAQAANLAPIIHAGFQLLSPDIFSFLNNNRSFLPSLPFRMVSTCTATGVTQAGNTMTTNPLNFFIQFVTVEECCTGGPGPGFQIGTGTGGDITQF